MAWLLIFSILWHLLLIIGFAVALDVSYCSPDNTGSDLPGVRDIYQSNGKCQEICGDEFAFAIIQGSECWCSNYAPGDSVDTLKCDEECPGFPDESCGSSASGLYGYFELSKPPSGKFAPAAAQKSDLPSRPDNAPLPPKKPTRTGAEETPSRRPSTAESATPYTTTSTTSESIPPSTSASDPTSTTLSASITPSPVVEDDGVSESVVTVTENGTTITSIAVANPSEDAAFGESSSTSSGTNPGKVAGIAIAAVAGVAAILALVFWVFYRKRRRNQSLPVTPENYAGDPAKTLPTRHASQMSQAGLIDKNPRIITTGLPAASGSNGAGTPVSQNNRYSAGTDMRLNPNALYAHEESQHSSISLQDNRDYSRQLQVRNPDA